MSKPGQRVLAELRKLIASGELAAGERIVEIPTAERLQVSRMPVRIALRTLEQEGLLCKTGRGYRVRAVTREDIAGAVEVRGVLEGLAARQAAERGLSAEARATLEECLAEGDRLFANGQVLLEELERYQRMNMRFHRTIIEASGNPAIAVALARNDHLPFASVSALAVDRDNLEQEFRRFNFAHMQHHAVVDALVNGQGARAEAIMREHANATLRYADYFDPARKGVTVLRRRRRRLEIQHQPWAARTRTAGREAIVGGLLLFAEVEVAMLRLAVQHAGQTGAADALLAGGRQVHPSFAQGRQHGLPGGDPDQRPVARQLHFEGAVRIGVPWRGGEVLAMQAACFPAQFAGAFFDPLHEARRPAKV